MKSIIANAVDTYNKDSEAQGRERIAAPDVSIFNDPQKGILFLVEFFPRSIRTMIINHVANRAVFQAHNVSYPESNGDDNAEKPDQEKITAAAGMVSIAFSISYWKN